MYSDMTPKPPFRLFKANQIIPIGRPFILTAIDAADNKYRRTEFYLFVFKMGTGVHYVKNHAEFNGIPDTMMSDEVLLSESYDSAEAELQKYVIAKRKELGPDVLPHDEYFEFEEVEPERLLFHIVYRKLFGISKAIRGSTECKELRDFLMSVRLLEQCSIDQPESEQTDIP